MEQQARFTRRHYFIDKSFQTKFILKFCALVALGGILTIALLYLLAGRLTSVAIVDSRVVVKSTADFILPMLIQTVVVVMLFISLAVITVTLFVSHKIAGPLYRFKKVMHRVGEGDFAGDFRIRKLDQFQDLADEFDVMLVKTRTQLGIMKERLASLEKALWKISEEEVNPAKRQFLAEVKKISEELTKIGDYFKV